MDKTAVEESLRMKRHTTTCAIAGVSAEPLIGIPLIDADGAETGADALDTDVDGVGTDAGGPESDAGGLDDIGSPEGGGPAAVSRNSLP